MHRLSHSTLETGWDPDNETSPHKMPGSRQELGWREGPGHWVREVDMS